MDYHYDEPPRDIQKEIFNRQLYLAVKYGKPVVIHDRDAHADSVDAVLAHSGVRGVFHSFSGSAETAKILRRAGFCISFSGVVTFKNAVKTVEACRTVDDGGFMVETDCPYLAPTPFRGKRNDSSLTKYTAERIAEIRGVSPEEIERLTDAILQTVAQTTAPSASEMKAPEFTVPIHSGSTGSRLPKRFLTTSENMTFQNTTRSFSAATVNPQYASKSSARSQEASKQCVPCRYVSTPTGRATSFTAGI